MDDGGIGADHKVQIHQQCRRVGKVVQIVGEIDQFKAGCGSRASDGNIALLEAEEFHAFKLAERRKLAQLNRSMGVPRMNSRPGPNNPDVERVLVNVQPLCPSLAQILIHQKVRSLAGN